MMTNEFWSRLRQNAFYFVAGAVVGSALAAWVFTSGFAGAWVAANLYRFPDWIVK